MSSELDQIVEEQKALQESIEQAQQKLAGLEDDLHAVDRELEALGEQNEQYDLLGQICASLDKLEELGAGELFWGSRDDPEFASRHLADVRRQMTEFGSKIREIEDRRAAVVADILEQDDVLAYLDDTLLELKEEEELRKSEWKIEREPTPTPFRRLIMPWARGCEEDERFRKSLLASVAASVLLALLLRLVELPIPDRAELIEVPERVARLVQPEPEPPPPVVEEEPVEPEPEPEEPDEELVAEEQPPEETPEAVTEPAPEPAAPKEQVRSKGILAFRDSFSERARSGPSAKLGAQARIGNSGEAAVGRPERSMVTTQGPGSSGGINLASLSRDVGGGGTGEQIDGVRVTRVESAIGGDGSADRPLSGGPSAGRTDEEIQIVFDRYKASLYRLYNRELRRDPTLRGQLVLTLTIEPDGSVSMCRLQSSDMDAPTLADQVVERVRGFDFGAKEDIVAMTIIYPIDFLPAT